MPVIIRHAEPDDAPALNRAITDPQVVWGTVQLPYQPVRNQRSFISELPQGHYLLVACPDSADVPPIGMIGLHVNSTPRRRHAASLGMFVRSDWWGQGVGSALLEAALDLADNWLNLRRVELEVWTDNERAVALYTKFGFVIEGTYQQYTFRAGQFVDAYSMARVREG